MSRIDDLIALIQTANEIFLINPARNVRSAYIQIDDLCELTMKSWLQSDTKSRQHHFLADLEEQGLVTSNTHRRRLEGFFERSLSLQGFKQALGIAPRSGRAGIFRGIIRRYTHHKLLNWLPTKNGGFKSFVDVINEIKARMPLPANRNLHEVLDRIKDRRDNRNHFFHDPDQAGLSVEQEHCLQAFRDLYRLADLLFQAEFTQRLHANPVVRAQLAVISLRARGLQTRIALDQYELAARRRGTIRLEFPNLGYELCLLYEDAANFLHRIQQHFQDLITERENEIARINGLTKPTQEHRHKIDVLNEEIALFRGIVSDCLS